jgi:hypothetical protein
MRHDKLKIVNGPVGAKALPADRQPRQETVAEGRQRRLNAVRKVAGLWKDRQDIPTDGLEYERLMRNE